ncbi:hypothetical protein [Acidimangrovimonas sediminis]|uniref:hypothetical protein n=1 Tax=Acidimangrovimonas sediminis TaxID=2056283 RepID=UPI0011AEEA79|nr:hypothetical protein [Acidimangrovimonas sediminis]
MSKIPSPPKRSWRVEDIDQLLSYDRVGNSEFLERARITAFLRRRWISGNDRLRQASSKQRHAILSRRQHGKALARKVIVAAKRGQLPEKAVRNIHRELLLGSYKPSVLLGGLVKNREKAWLSVPKRIKVRQSQQVTVSNFSFLENPSATIKTLASIANSEAQCLAASIDFTDEHCLDIGPWLVLSVMRQDMLPIFVGGAISNSMSKVMAALRLDETLSMQVLPVWSGKQDIWAFPVKQRRPPGTSTSPTLQLEPQTKEKTGDELCDAIDEWLATCVQQELSRVGRRLVKTIVGETLDNAERHSNPIQFPDDGDWMVSGMTVRRGPDNSPSFQCQLAFLSVGSSVAETIDTCPSEIKDRMDRYVRAHRGAFVNKQLASEHLKTIFALQPGVSRDPEAVERGSGGTGFSDILRLFADLAGIESETSKAKLAIVSGRTCIHIGFPLVRSNMWKFGTPGEIWFNEANSESEPPDKRFVIGLDEEFKGTLVTMAFTLNREYLERTANGTG